MAIKINLMPASEKKGWQIPQGDYRLHTIAFLVLLFSLLAFLGVYLYKIYLFPKQLSGLEKEQSDLTEMISNSFDLNLISVGEKAKNVDILLKGRLYKSKIFDLLESFTLKNVFYDKFALQQGSVENTAIRADISGHTENFAALSKQMAIFASRKEFLNIKFDGGEMDKDGIVKFKISMDINQDFIKNNK